jgi:hypothetical protein
MRRRFELAGYTMLAASLVLACATLAFACKNMRILDTSSQVTKDAFLSVFLVAMFLVIETFFLGGPLLQIAAKERDRWGIIIGIAGVCLFAGPLFALYRGL